MKSLPFVLAVVVLLLDQVFKSHFPNVISNSGYAFGLLVYNDSVDKYLNLLLLFVLVLFNSRYVQTKSLKTVGWLIIIVAISNLIDRWTLGHVVDYISVGGISFNLADLSISICILAGIYLTWKNYDRHRN